MDQRMIKVTGEEAIGQLTAELAVALRGAGASEASATEEAQRFRDAYRMGFTPPSPVSVRPSCSEAADMVTAELARTFEDTGMTPEGSLRNAERIRRVYQRAFTADVVARLAHRVPAPAQRHESACARYGAAAGSVSRDEYPEEVPGDGGDRD